jgi:hypothetical protein
MKIQCNNCRSRCTNACGIGAFTSAVCVLLLLLLLLPLQHATARTHTQQSKPKLQDSTNQAATTGSEVPYLHTVGSGAGALAARFAALLGTEEPLGSEDIAALTRSLR